MKYACDMNAIRILDFFYRSNGQFSLSFTAAHRKRLHPYRDDIFTYRVRKKLMHRGFEFEIDKLARVNDQPLPQNRLMQFLRLYPTAVQSQSNRD